MDKTDEVLMQRIVEKLDEHEMNENLMEHIEDKYIYTDDDDDDDEAQAIQADDEGDEEDNANDDDNMVVNEMDPLLQITVGNDEILIEDEEEPIGGNNDEEEPNGGNNDQEEQTIDAICVGYGCDSLHGYTRNVVEWLQCKVCCKYVCDSCFDKKYKDKLRSMNGLKIDDDWMQIYYEKFIQDKFKCHHCINEVTECLELFRDYTKAFYQYLYDPETGRKRREVLALEGMNTFIFKNV